MRSYLGAVSAGASVGHGKKTLLGVLELEVLVGELGWEQQQWCRKIGRLLYALPFVEITVHDLYCGLRGFQRIPTSVDGLATGTIASGEVATLAHELRDHSVKLAVLVAETLLASAKSTEVLSSLGNSVGV